MTRGPLSFKGTDLERAIKHAKKAGLKVASVEINTKTGSILVHAGEPEAANDNNIDDDWDKALSHEHR
jgi:hypothetical protein